MGELIGASLLAVLAAYVVWDSLSTGKRGYRVGAVPGQAAADFALLVAAVVVAVMGAVLAVQPSHPPFTGRGAFLWSALYGSMGALGMPLAFLGSSPLPTAGRVSSLSTHPGSLTTGIP